AWVETQAAQEQQREQVGAPVRRGDAVTPLAVGPLLVEELGAPAFRRDPRALGSHSLGRLVAEVPHDLPADRRIGIEQPLSYHRWAHGGAAVGSGAATDRSSSKSTSAPPPSRFKI